MAAKTGVDILVRIGNTRRTVTLANGSAGETFTLTLNGQTTGAIAYDAAAATVQAALEALADVEVGDVVVAGVAGGPFTVTFQGEFAGQEIEEFTGEGTGDLAVAITDPGPTYVTLGGQRGATLNRGSAVADATSKDSAGWEENQPTFRNWAVDADGLLIADDAAFLALRSAYRYKRRVNVLILDGGSSESGIGTITDFPTEAPHDDMATIAITIQGSGALTEA